MDTLDVKDYKVIINKFGIDVIRSTKHLEIAGFYQTSSKQLISLLGIYILNIKNEKEHRTSIKFNEFIIEAHSILQTYNNWQTFSELLLSTDNLQLKSTLENSNLFEVENDSEWETTTTRTKNIILNDSKSRIEFLHSLIINNIFDDDSQ